MTVQPLPDDRHAIEMHDLRCAGHFDLAAALEAERKAWRAAEARAAGYERGRRDMLNALLAPNPNAAARLARLSNSEPDVEGRLPFDVVFWVSEVAEQLGIKPVHKCFICARPFRAGEMVLPDIAEGLGHRACYGEDREGFVNLKTGEPIGADEPLPTGEPYDPAEYPGYAAPDELKAVAPAGKAQPDFAEIGRDVMRWLSAVGTFDGMPSGAGVIEIIATLCGADRGLTDEAVTDSTIIRQQLAELMSSADGLLRQIDTSTASLELATEWWRLKEACLKASAALQSQPSIAFSADAHG